MHSIDKQKREKNLASRIGVRKHAINVDLFDIEKFNELKSASKTLIKKLKEGKQEYKVFSELIEDAFGLLFRYAPQFCEDWELNAEYLLNLALEKKVKDSSEYKKLRNNTRLNELCSMIGTEVLAQQFLDLLKELEEQRKAANQLAQAQKACDKAEKGEGEEEDGEKGPGQQASEELSLEEAKKRLEEARNNFNQSIKKPEFAAGVEKAMFNTSQSVREVKETIKNWGLEESDSYTNTPYAEKLAMIERINKGKLKKIANLAGRFKRLAMATRSEQVKRGINEIFSITLGSSFERLIATERARMGSKNKWEKLKFWADWSEKKTLIYELRGKEKKYMGPIVVCIDNSGSMSGEGEVWAKAVALGILEIAQYQKRSMFVIQFSAQYRTENLKVHQFLRGSPPNITEVLAMAEYFEGGGTMFETPLNKAREIIDSEGEFKKADIIFITDGEAAVGSSWVSNYKLWKKSKNVSVYSILVDTGYASLGTLKEFSDKIEKVSDLKGGNSNDSIAINTFRNL